MYKVAKPGRWMYNSSVVTDQDPHDMAISLMRGKLLDMLDKELPYSINASIRFWEEDLSGNLKIKSLQWICFGT
jgi:GTPase Era involved in 16S rRNA processing